jgi:hypothetical protein
VVEAVESAPFASFALPSRQGVEVRGQLDLRAPVEAARVDRDARVAIEDVDDRGRGQEGERSSDAIVWDAVVVAVKADIRLLAAAHLNAVDRGEVVVRQGQQPCRLVLPGLQDGQGVVLGAGPRAVTTERRLS